MKINIIILKKIKTMPEMINLDVTNKTANKHNTNRPQIHDHPYRALTIGDS